MGNPNYGMRRARNRPAVRPPEHLAEKYGLWLTTASGCETLYRGCFGNSEVSMSGVNAPNYVSRLSAKPVAAPIVFVVDDDISIRESLEALLLGEGWRPKLFESAR